jgi:hypothetical protein
VLGGASRDESATLSENVGDPCRTESYAFLGIGYARV